MKHPIERLACWANNRHCRQLHNADYEVCGDFWCALAYWLEDRAQPFQEYYR